MPLKRKYRYKSIEITTHMRKNELYTGIRNKILSNYTLWFIESGGWSQEKQAVFIETLKSKGIVIIRLS